MKVAVLTGEPSGDLLAEAALAQLRTLRPDIELLGIGGEGLARVGLKSRFALSEFAVNGITEVLPHLPRLLFRIEQITRWILRENPAVVLTVDAPDLTLRIAKQLRARGYEGKLVHLVAPTVWAWKPDRAAKVAAFLDHLFCLFPFEPPYFEAEGLSAQFVGHPLAEQTANEIEKDPGSLLLLPGSRMNEVRQLVPLFRNTVERLSAEHKGLRCVVPTVETTRAFVTKTMSNWPTPVEFLFRPEDKAKAFAQSAVGLAASGTVALELAKYGVAGVITYRLADSTFRSLRRQSKLNHFSLINILADTEVMPERVQDQANAEVLAPELLMLLTDEEARNQQVALQNQALSKLTLPEGQSTATLVAEKLAELLPN